MAWLAQRQIGGQTGDVLGGAEQVAETAILLLLAARLGGAMNGETNLWLIRHAPVDGPRGVIHGPDAPADLGDAAALCRAEGETAGKTHWRSAARRAAPARRPSGWARCGRDRPAFREQDFGAWTGRRHNDLVTELGDAYREFWKSPASNRPPGGESFVDQIARAGDGLASLPAGDVVLVVHSGTIRAVLAIALDLAPDTALRFVIDPLSLTRIDRLETAGAWLR